MKEIGVELFLGEEMVETDDATNTYATNTYAKAVGKWP